MGFLTLDPELDEGRVKLTGDDEADEEKAIVYVIGGFLRYAGYGIRCSNSDSGSHRWMD